MPGNNEAMIGRKKEQQLLLEAYNDTHSQFVVVYGRRRIGKTFLVRETFDYKFSFSYSGVANVSARAQLREFALALQLQGAKFKAKPRNWSEAFHQLSLFLETLNEPRKVVFIDEMPWMDGPRSGFVSAFEHFWNGWATARKDILLIVCGSASSWIINKVFKNRGGLHNRVNTRIHLSSFTLRECEEMAKELHLPWKRRQIAEAYMVMGGVPYYWSKLKKTMSVAQNIDALFFAQNGEFRYEYNDLYASIFSRPEKYLQVIEALALKKEGLTRERILEITRLPDNGSTSQILEDLIHCGFIRKYCHLNKAVNSGIFQLVDNYTLFYHHFLKNNRNADEGFWLKNLKSGGYNAWIGLAFERLCMRHIHQIKVALGVSGIIAEARSWHAGASANNSGTQIDMLIDRADDVINLCEMKYAQDAYSLNASDWKSLQNKINRLSEDVPPSKAIVPVMVAPYGLTPNEYSQEIPHVITLDDLFQ